MGRIVVSQFITVDGVVDTKPAGETFVLIYEPAARTGERPDAGS